jgi:hypothetical protein
MSIFRIPISPNVKHGIDSKATAKTDAAKAFKTSAGILKGSDFLLFGLILN